MIDERTGRPIGDHGIASQAIDYALDVVMNEDCDCSGFLRAWREGSAMDEWPEFYTWLAAQEEPVATVVGRTELGGGGNG